jgi:hypothetical protein
VTVHQGNFDSIPYSNYFANLIVSEETVREGRVPEELNAISRHLKPAGGVLCLGVPHSSDEKLPESASAGQRTGLGIADHSEFSVVEGYTLLTRGMLPGAGNWSHQYGNPDNTAVSRDTRVTGDLGVLWYGDPGAEQMVNRHEGAVGPLAVNGRLFVQGEWSIMAYDAYNGAHLWTHENPEAIRTGVFQNQNPGNLAAGEEGLFHFLGDKCYQLDLATGKLVATHSLPPDADEGRHQWVMSPSREVSYSVRRPFDRNWMPDSGGEAELPMKRPIRSLRSILSPDDICGRTREKAFRIIRSHSRRIRSVLSTVR